MPKLQFTSQQNAIFETLASNANKKYYFFPKVYIKLDNNQFEEVDLKDLPEGIQKYIQEKSK